MGTGLRPRGGNRVSPVTVAVGISDGSRVTGRRSPDRGLAGLPFLTHGSNRI